MTKLTRPTIRLYNTEQKISELTFGTKSNPMNGSYYLRGGICFPVPVRLGADKGAGGFVLICGCNVTTKKIYVFEDRSFLTIDHIVGQDGSVEFEGLSGWLNECWSYYFARDFYWHQDDQTKKTYMLDILRSTMIKPRPRFLHIDWTDDNQIEHLIWRLGNTGVMKFKADSELHESLRLLEVQTDNRQIIPGVHALKCALAGLMRHPYRKRPERNVDKPLDKSSTF